MPGPSRLYQGAVGAQYRYFPHKLPLAFDRERATFVFVQAEAETESAVHTWGTQHAKLWAMLAEAGRVDGPRDRSEERSVNLAATGVVGSASV